MTDDDWMLILEKVFELERLVERLENDVGLMRMDVAQLRMEFAHEAALLEMEMATLQMEISQEVARNQMMIALRRRLRDGRAASHDGLPPPGAGPKT